MEHVQILDCTLRDGGYLVDKSFGEENIKGIVKGLVDTGIDIIELGFLQNEGFGEGKTVFRNSVEAEKYIPKNRKKSMFTAFADCSRYDVKQLDNYSGRSFDAVRECFFKHERDCAVEKCKIIKERGYLCFVQPVDILGYSDIELISLIEKINEVEPYCFSIVDTFGSMYEDDLQRIFSVIHHNLIPGCKIGFHSHNNLQMSSALSQALLKFAYGKRDVVVDATISGMGRGAGNTPTELIAQYMIDKLQYTYNIDSLLDVIDNNMRNIRSKAEWGYNTPFYLAGAYSAHVNNISYLIRKNSISSKDIRFILNKLDENKRKRYDYDLLEDIYTNYLESDIDDRATIKKLKSVFENKNVVILAAGSSVTKESSKIKEYINAHDSIVISINNRYTNFNSDYIYFSNVKRYQTWHSSFKDTPCIITANIKRNPEKNEFVISLKRLIKCGWQNMDNSTILLLRLLDILEVGTVGIAGFDGYDYSNNYADNTMEYYIEADEIKKINTELTEMLQDFLKTRKSAIKIDFITTSKLYHVEN